MNIRFRLKIYFLVWKGKCILWIMSEVRTLFFLSVQPSCKQGNILSHKVSRGYNVGCNSCNIAGVCSPRKNWRLLSKAGFVCEVCAKNIFYNNTAASATVTAHLIMDRADSVDRLGMEHFKVTAQFPLDDSNCHSRNVSSPSAVSMWRWGRLILLHTAMWVCWKNTDKILLVAQRAAWDGLLA